MWKPDLPYQPETKKIVWEVAPYLRGRGMDIGAGMFKVLPQAISIDNGHHEMFGHYIKPDFVVGSADDMSMFASQSQDYIYSSHLLEHMEDPAKALKEWWRLIRIKGVMVLYLPHEDLYPKVGENGANPDHKHNLNEEKVVEWMKKIGSWDLERCEQRNEDDEYSFLMVFRKLDGKNRHLTSYTTPKPTKTACVVRYGAFGDMIQTSTIFAGLKKEGYHVTCFCSPPGSDVIMHDPNVDKFVFFEKDQVPNADLGPFWAWHREHNFDKFVNLSESVEGTFLALRGRVQYEWNPAARHFMMNGNSLEFMHKIAGLPHSPQVKFYATDEEKAWARKQRKHIPYSNLIIWSLAGSAVHKTWAGLDNIMASIFVSFPDTAVMLVGGPECQILEAGWENEARVYRTCGKFSIRESLAMLEHADLVIGPETGVLNTACCMSMPKLVFLSHTTQENLTRDWVNVYPLASKSTECPGRGKNEAPACHMLHYGFQDCKRDEAAGVAQCQSDITVAEVWSAMETALNKIEYERRAVA